MSTYNNNDTQLSNYDQYLTQQEEDERMRRLLEKEEAIARKVNAQDVSNLIKEGAHPIPKLGVNPHIVHPVDVAEPLNLHKDNLTEAERLRRLQDNEEAIARRVKAQDVASLIREENDKPLTLPELHKMEEDERLRRLADNEEAISRKRHAKDSADGIRTEASTIKARFVRRPRSKLWKKAQRTMETGKGLYNNITSQPASATLEQTYGAAKNIAAAYMPSMPSMPHMPHMPHIPSIPSISSLMHAANSIKDTVMHNIPFVAHPMSLADVKAAEEVERARRIAEDKDSAAVGNAKRVANLVKFNQLLRLPKAYPSGFHKFTNGLEERERTRRLANKGEMGNRRMQSMRVANAVNRLGWPFIRSAKGKLPLTPSARLAEDERERLMSDPKHMLTSRYNAKKVADLISTALKPIDNSIMHRYTRELEEKERRHRMKNPDAAIHGAHKHADLLKGTRFFIPSHTLADQVDAMDYNNAVKRSTPHEFDTLEMTGARDRQRKLAKRFNKAQNPVQQQLPQDIKHSQEVSRDLPKHIDTKWMEEDERQSRLSDKPLQQLAMDNAHKVSSLIHKKKGPYKQRQVAFKPDIEHIPFNLGFYVSPPSAQCAPLERSLTPTVVSTRKPSLTDVTPMQFANISPASLQLTPLERASLPVDVHAQGVHTPALEAAHPLLNSKELPLPTLEKAPQLHKSPLAPTQAHIPTQVDSPYPERARAAPMHEDSTFGGVSGHNTALCPSNNRGLFNNAPLTSTPLPTPTFNNAPLTSTPLPTPTFNNAPLLPHQVPLPASPAPAVMPPTTHSFVPPTHLPTAHSVAPLPTHNVAPLTHPHPSAAPLPTYNAAPLTHPHPSAAPLPTHNVVPQPVLKPVSTQMPPTFTQPLPPTTHNVVHPQPVLKPVSTQMPTFTQPLPSTYSAAPVYTPTTHSLPHTFSTPTHTQPAPIITPVLRPLPTNTLTHSPLITTLTPVTSPAVWSPQPAHHTTHTPLFTPMSVTTTTTHAADPRQHKLVDSVRKLYEDEIAQAEKERQKMLTYQAKNSGWARYRAQRHATAAARHNENAKRHQDWLNLSSPTRSAM